MSTNACAQTCEPKPAANSHIFYHAIFRDQQHAMRLYTYPIQRTKLLSLLQEIVLAASSDLELLAEPSSPF